MKTTINFTNSRDDIHRYSSSEDLRQFYQCFGCSGLELMLLDSPDESLIRPDMITGIHLYCPGDWITKERSSLLQNYRQQLDYAQKVQAEYVVFHVTQVSDEECLSYQMIHQDEEIVDASCDLINELLDEREDTFDFLMENLWWPGLNFLRPSVTEQLLKGVHYAKKGLMLDTGHFLHTNRELHTEKEALQYLHAMLDEHGTLTSYIRGIHLHQSLTGDYVNEWLKHPPVPDADPVKRSAQVFTHIFSIDRHLPFTDPEVKKLIQRICPKYLTYEYITQSREEHLAYLTVGITAAEGKKKVQPVSSMAPKAHALSSPGSASSLSVLP